MALALPRSLSPSKIGTFTSCPLAFRFGSIDHLPEPPTLPAALGTLVHRVLDGLFWHYPPGQRSLTAAGTELEAVFATLDSDPELVTLSLDEAGIDAWRREAQMLVDNYFTLEDPNAVRDVGVEMTLEADVRGVRLRGILDRLDIDADGELTVVDYKTGKVPSASAVTARLAGVQLYALLCEHVLQRRPARVRLLYLRGPTVIEAVPTDQGLSGVVRRTSAVWAAIERACEHEDFRPRPSALCSWCAFRPLCPAHGGDPCQLGSPGQVAGVAIEVAGGSPTSSRTPGSQPRTSAGPVADSDPLART